MIRRLIVKHRHAVHRAFPIDAVFVLQDLFLGLPNHVAESHAAVLWMVFQERQRFLLRGIDDFHERWVFFGIVCWLIHDGLLIDAAIERLACGHVHMPFHRGLMIWKHSTLCDDPANAGS